METQQTTREKSKEEAVKKWEKKKKCSSPKGVGKVLNKKKGKFYLIGKCITMLLCSHE
ncbi:small polypeptide DEVIL 7 [Raphanus sativus]|uniref:Small polypeptide DEVIL 7 n=1 Tax=Raphanus sativus TaxID=3726 RepID=A0A6J0JSH4_RAPSA|nr:small polypeptide DEVIL 7 [Raphanus sativus]